MGCDSGPLLGVNIDHVATLRQARGTRYPAPVHAALEAETGGADAITLHLREDRRHIQDHDVERVLEAVTARVNLEMAVTDEMLALAERLRPADCCLVPERRQELTTEGGLDVVGQLRRLSEACARLAEAGIRVSLFIDADPEQVEAAARAGAATIELHTGPYADAGDRAAQEAERRRLEAAVRHGCAAGLQVNAGHGLHYHNVAPVAALSGVAELNIGHAIVARAVFAGLRTAVGDMRRIVRGARAAADQAVT